jgi:hypothetical protein
MQNENHHVKSYAGKGTTILIDGHGCFGWCLRPIDSAGKGVSAVRHPVSIRYSIADTIIAALALNVHCSDGTNGTE